MSLEWNPRQLADALAAGAPGLRVVDVREDDEWAFNRIDGAVHIPLSAFAQRGPAELDSGERIVLYCHHGMRSAQAQAYLLANGFPEVINLAGGIDAWSVEVDARVPRY